MKKNYLILLLITILMLSLCACNASTDEFDQSASFAINMDGKTIKAYTISDLQAMEATAFKATKSSKGMDPQENDYVGVSLIDVLKDSGIEIDQNAIITCTASDGYSVTIDTAKALDSENVYLTYMQNKKPIANESEGGDGPIMVIVSKDAFSNKWCKFAVSCEIN
jgi:hypothetical protein